MATYVAIASAVASGIAGYRSSQAQADQMKAQAKQAEIQGRADAIEYKRQSVEVMRKMNAVMSANIAKADSVPKRFKFSANFISFIFYKLILNYQAH